MKKAQSPTIKYPCDVVWTKEKILFYLAHACALGNKAANDIYQTIENWGRARGIKETIDCYKEGEVQWLNRLVSYDILNYPGVCRTLMPAIPVPPSTGDWITHRLSFLPVGPVAVEVREIPLQASEYLINEATGEAKVSYQPGVYVRYNDGKRERKEFISHFDEQTTQLP